MELQKIVLQNFKNFDYYTQDLTSKFELRKPNAWGKSSIADAIGWVMFGKLSNGSSDIASVKPKTNTRALTIVELQFDSGLNLMKSFQEKWTRTRGTTEETLTGHETKCYINGNEVKVSDYDKEIKSYFNINFDGKWNGNLIQLLIDPLFFGQKMEWQDRRKLVIDLVGDVTDEDVFKFNSYLRPLQQHLILNKGKFDLVKKSLNTSKAKLLEQEIQLKAQIEFASVKTINQNQYEFAVGQVNTINESIAALKKEQSQSLDDANRERNQMISDLKNKLADSKQNDINYMNTQNQSINNELEQVRNEKTKIQSVLNEKTQTIQSVLNDLKMIDYKKQQNEREIKDLQTRKDRLVNEWQKVKAEVFVNNHSLVCPNCNFDLHGEEVKKAEDNFNINKAKRLKDIQDNGQALATQIQALQAISFENDINTLNNNKNELESVKINLNAMLNELSQKENLLKQDLFNNYESIWTVELKESLNTLLNTNTSPMAKDYTSEIIKLGEELKPHQSLINQYNAEVINLKRAETLKQQLNDVVINIAEYESLLGLLTDFIKLKLEILKNKVSAVFGDIEIQLVENNIKEGSWNEVCYILDNGVPYHLTNSASKIRLGIKINEAIRQALNITGIPYVIDNAEQITNRNFDTQEQTICLIAEDTQGTNENQLSLF